METKLVTLSTTLRLRSVWPSGQRRWLVVRTVVSSNPGRGEDCDSHFVRPWQRCLKSVSHEEFLRCLPVYGGTTSAIHLLWVMGHHPRCFDRSTSSPKG